MPLLSPLNPRLDDWKGKTVWLIGASTGIGRATAALLAPRRVRFIIAGARDGKGGFLDAVRLLRGQDAPAEFALMASVRRNTTLVFVAVSTPLSKDPLATYSDGHALESKFKRNLEEQEDYVAMMQQY